MRAGLRTGVLAIAIAGCGNGDDGGDGATSFGMTGVATSQGPIDDASDGEDGDGPAPTGDDSTGGGPGDATATATATDDGPTTSDDTTGGSSFDGEPGDFTLQFDGRDYRMYVPTGYAAGASIPVLVGFHGAGDTGGNFAMFTELVGMKTAAEPDAYILIVPDTKSPFSDWANWSGNPNADIDEMIAEMDEVLALVDDVGSHYDVDAQQVHAFGFSNGGLFTAIAGMARADRFATLAVLGYGWGASYLPPSPPARTIPVQFGCGSSDGFYGGAQASESFLAGAGHDTRLVTANGVGHMFTGVMGALTPADMFGWMQARPLP